MKFDGLYKEILLECSSSSQVLLTEGVIDSLFAGAKNVKIISDIKNMLASFKSISAEVYALIKKYVAILIKNMDSKVMSFLKTVLQEVKSKVANKQLMLPMLVIVLSVASTFAANGAIKDHMSEEEYVKIVKVFKQSNSEMGKTYTNMKDEQYEELQDILSKAIEHAKKDTSKKAEQDLDVLRSMDKDNTQMHFYYNESADGDWSETVEVNEEYVIEIDDDGKIESITTKSFDELLDIVQDAKMNRMDKRWANPVKLYSTVNDKTMVINGLSRDDNRALRDYLFKHRVI